MRSFCGIGLRCDVSPKTQMVAIKTSRHGRTVCYADMFVNRIGSGLYMYNFAHELVVKGNEWGLQNLRRQDHENSYSE